MNRTRLARALAAALLLTPLLAVGNTRPVKGFILAGQSNMEGHAKPETL